MHFDRSFYPEILCADYLVDPKLCLAITTDYWNKLLMAKNDEV